MKFIKFKWIFLLTLFCSIQAQSNEGDIKLNYSLSEKIMSEVCSFREIDEKEIRASKAINSMVSHFKKFRDYFSIESYIKARKAAANCVVVENDYYRFNQIVENKEKYEKILINSKSIEVESILNSLMDYMPDEPVKVEAYFLIGTPSCGGWSDDSFYVDLPCIDDDLDGLELLVKHEIFHILWGKNITTEPKSLLEKFLYDMLNEGIAESIADFSNIKEPKRYSQNSVKAFQVNRKRIKQNFDLMDIFISNIQSEPNEANFKRIYNIGFSGSYESPMYSVGSEIFNRVKASVSHEEIVCMVKKSPLSILKRYQSLSLTDNSIPRLGSRSNKIFESVVEAFNCAVSLES